MPRPPIDGVIEDSAFIECRRNNSTWHYSGLADCDLANMVIRVLVVEARIPFEKSTGIPRYRERGRFEDRGIAGTRSRRAPVASDGHLEVVLVMNDPSRCGSFGTRDHRTCRGHEKYQDRNQRR